MLSILLLKIPFAEYEIASTEKSKLKKISLLAAKFAVAVPVICFLPTFKLKFCKLKASLFPSKELRRYIPPASVDAAINCITLYENDFKSLVM